MPGSAERLTLLREQFRAMVKGSIEACATPRRTADASPRAALEPVDSAWRSDA